MMTRRAISFLSLTVVLMALPAAGQQPPERERGFKPDLVYQFKGFDSVNLMNGNLNLTIPIAEYSVSAGLSYSFVLRYSGNIWKSKEDCEGGPGDPPDPGEDPICDTRWSPQNDNIGMGWGIGFGELHPAASGVEDGTATSMWRYETADHSEHLFYDVLHGPKCSGSVTTNCDPATPGVGYSRDGTYLRLKGDDSVKVIEFPDGQRHRFAYDAVTDEWRLQYIYSTSSSLSPTGVPTSNWVKFEYPASSVYANTVDWRITDSHGREHYVYFQAKNVVNRIEVATFRLAEDPEGVKADYHFTYDDHTTSGSGISKPCSSLPQTPPNAAVRLLSRIDLPSGDIWQFAYNTPISGCDDFSGTMTQATLPTLGTINWTYQKYALGSYDAIGVASRALEEPNGNELERTVYARGEGATTVETQKNSSGQWRPDSKTVNYFDYTYGSTFGLPYKSTVSDGTAKTRKLSSETYDCDPVSNTCSASPELKNYVKYEMDDVFEAYGCSIDFPCARDRNRRVVSERTLYVTDGNRYADSDSSLFDGLGHYRQTNTAGNFSGGNDRESYTGFNLNAGIYSLNSDGTRAPGFTMLNDSESWVLNTFSESYVKEGSEYNRTLACFDLATGFLQRKRALADTSGVAGPEDLLTVYTRDPVSGYASREESFGGDLLQAPEDPQQPLSTSPLCTMSLPAHNRYSFRQDYTFEFGALKTSRSVNGATGVPMPFYSVQNSIIDRNTGLVKESLDASGLATTYFFDHAMRPTSVAPPGIAATDYTYTPASSNTMASVRATTGAGPASVQHEWQFDPFGRISIEKTLMPDGTWSGRKTQYDFAGRKLSVSEQETVAGSTFDPAHKTIFSDYDPFGRARSVIAPDNKATAFSFVGERLATRTVIVATPSGDVPVSVTEERDRAGRLIRVTEDAGGTPTLTQYAYDAGNRLSSVVMDSAQPARVFNYDGRGFLNQEFHPESGTTSYEHDAKGHVITKTIPTIPATTLTYAYDPAERVTKIKSNNQDLKGFSYDRPNSGNDYSNGKLNFAVRHNRNTALGSDVQVTETYTYKGVGGRVSKRTTALSTGESFTDGYTYDSLGNVFSVDYPKCTGCDFLSEPSRTAVNLYNAGRVTEVLDYAHLITYHPNGFLKSIQHLNGNGTQGPRYAQAIDNGMVRPSVIEVSEFCDDLAINTQPQPKTVSSGSPAGLLVTATGATTFQWYKRVGTIDTLLAGQTSSTLGTIVTETTTFWVRVGNGTCTVDSQAALVTVTTSCAAPPATITANPASSITAGTNGSASVPATGGASYAWSITNGTITSGQGTPNILFRANCSGTTVGLGVTVTTSCAGSDTHVLTNTLVTAVVSVIGPSTISEGGSTTIRATLAGTAPWTVTWSDNVTQTITSGTTADRTVSPAGTTTYTVSAVSDANCTGAFTGQAVITARRPFRQT